MRRDVAAILFDIDGTLVDSTPAVERTWRTWAAGRGLDADQILRSSHGRRSEDTIADLLPPPDRAGAVRELLTLELGDLEGVVALPTRPHFWGRYPRTLGRRDFWLACTDANAPLGCGTTGAVDSVSGEDVTAGKPDPEGYLAAASALGVDPTACLVIEDAPAGIHAGRASGAFVVAVATSHPSQALSDADLVIDDLGACQVTSTDGGLQVTVEVPTHP